MLRVHFLQNKMMNLLFSLSHMKGTRSGLCILEALESFTMPFLILSLVSLFVANTFAVDYVLHPDKDKDFDGIAITNLKSVEHCTRRTKTGDRLKVHFNATMPDGKLIESTYARQRAFDFIIGEGMVIGGFEAGLRDMCIGEIRHLMVPPKYAYGDWQLGSTVPARVTFHFTVELIDFTSDALRRKTNLFKTIDVNDDALISPEEVKRYLSNEQLNDKANPINELLKDIFKMEDHNSDGFINHSEFGGFKRDEL